MLVLSRKVDQRLYIGDDIVITIVAVKGEHTVKLGIEAPKHIQIEREEVRRSETEQIEEADDYGIYSA